MTPTPEQVAQWAEECATEVVDYDVLGKPITDAGALIWSVYRPLLIRLVTRAMAEQAEADAKLCDELAEHYSAYKDTALLNGDIELSNAASGEPRAAQTIASIIRANAPKVTT